MTIDPSNQREFTRVPVDCKVAIVHQGQPVECSHVRVLSMKGMLVQSPAQLPQGTECEITIALVDDEVEIQLIGDVVHSYPDSLAFQFTKIMGPESYAHLRNLVLYNAQDIEQVEREFESHAGLRKKEG